MLLIFRKDDFIIKAVIPNVKVGSIIDFEYEVVESSPEDPNQFYTSWYFGGNNPVFESKVKFIVPENKDFYYVMKNFNNSDKKPKITIEDGYRIYSFERGKCPPFVPEPNSPPVEELYPSVYGSLFKDQTYLSNWLSVLMKERMVSNDKMNSLIDQILKKTNAKTEEEIQKMHEKARADLELASKSSRDATRLEQELKDLDLDDSDDDDDVLEALAAEVASKAKLEDSP